MEPQESAPQSEEQIPEPADIAAARDVLARVGKMIDAGEVEAISVFVQHRNGTYVPLQTRGESRHEDAGRLMEFMLLRLGFIHRDDVEAMIDRL